METIKQQTWAACGCLAARFKFRVRGALPTTYRLPLCLWRTTPLQRLLLSVALYRCYAFNSVKKKQLLTFTYWLAY